MIRIKRFLEYRICSSCKNEFLAYQVAKINKTDYICQNCKMCKSYYFKNGVTKGKQKEMSFSFEFETSRKVDALYELSKFDFVGCSDGSICGLEWKSPIFYNKKSFHNICRKIDKFSKYVGRDCGTHLHVGTKSKQVFELYKRELFKPILKVMIEDSNKTIKFWGRNFNHYCQAQISDSRYNSFNTRSSVETLEFRLLKFISAEQYIRACDFCIDTTKFLNHAVLKEGFNRKEAIRIGEIIAKKYREVIKDV